jgi:hypothetical protein
LVPTGLLEYGLKFGGNFLPPKKLAVKKGSRKKCYVFFTIKNKYFKLFLLVSFVKFLEIYDKNEESKKIFF